MTTIGSIGVGLFILIIIWIFALLAFVVAVRTQSNFGWIALAAATIITITLIVIPTEKPQKTPDDIDSLDKDFGYVYRTVLLLFLILSVIIAFISFFVLHCIEPVRPKPIKSFCAKPL